MVIITDKEINAMIDNIRVDINTLKYEFILDDLDLKKKYENYAFLSYHQNDIISKFQFSLEQVLYSQYYWFIDFKNSYISNNGYDAGLEQQGFQMLEHISNLLNGNINWVFMESVESQLQKR
ncbi:hypothetical protein [Priestia koreensis]|uniref:hypothetical protein n=1 Tax=Priestia koreensis TaxID=284581 RepID=UPI00301A627D